MSDRRILRVYVGASDGLDETRSGVLDLLVQLNRHFRGQGVEFEPTLPGEDASLGDLAVALYWKDFGELPKDGFEAAYEAFKDGGKPKIYVFFKEPSEDIDEALKAFRDSFAERYGHFYCHFETVDKVKFEMTVQSLSMLPGYDAGETLKIEGAKVVLGNETVAELEKLPFAKMNAKRKSLLRQIASAESEVAALEEDAKASPDDSDLQDALREVRVKHHNLQEELKTHDGFLFDVAVTFVKAMAEETSERTRKAWELFQQGKVQEANRLLDWIVLKESTERNRRLFQAQRDAFEKNLQEYLAKAKIAMADDSMSIPERVDVASRAYEEAIAIAREIRTEAKDLAEILFDYGHLLQNQNRFQDAIERYSEALAIRRTLAASQPAAYRPTVATTLNNLGALHDDTQQLKQAEAEFEEALSIRRKLAEASPEAVGAVAEALNNLANLCQKTQRLPTAEAKYREALSIWRKLVAAKPDVYEPREAATLNNLAVLHEKMKRLPEAEVEHSEALSIRRKLANAKPKAYEPDVAASLSNLAGLYWKTNRIPEAEATHSEAVTVYRKLAAKNPEAYEPYVAKALNNLAILHSDTGRFSDAEAEYADALVIWRRLATAHPEAYEPDLADTLYNLADFHRETKRVLAAEAEFSEALTILRKLAAVNPSAHEAAIGKILCKSIVLYTKNGRDMEAVAMAQEALDVCGRCERRTPGQFEKHLNLLVKLIKALRKKIDR